MNTNDRPFFIPGTHPVELGKYVIVTAPIFRLFTLLSKCIIGLKSGCIVFGKSRIGKTWGIKGLTTMLNRELGISVLCHDMLEHEKKTEREFFRNILSSFDHEKAKSRANAGEMFDAVINYFIEEAGKNVFNRLLFFIDEAQWLKPIQYGYLRGMFNVLINRGVIPIFVLVGDYNLLIEYKKYESMDNQEIIGRFMNELFEFKGIRTEKEVHLVLHGYDITEAPDGSGWTYTRYFFPTAYESGWRLASQSKILFNTYTEIMIEEGKKKRSIELPMSHLAPAVQYLLTNYSDLDLKVPVFSREAWYEALNFVIRPAYRRPPTKG